MEITGKVHCFFEQSGTFKNEFIKLGIPAEDYDIQNNFGQTDNVIDLFSEIDKEYAILQRERERENNFCRHNKRRFNRGFLSLHLFYRVCKSLLLHT
jgi:hypothetical protein